MKNNIRLISSAGIMAAAIAFMAFGIWRGETAEVLTKAINICFECIGLG